MTRETWGGWDRCDHGVWLTLATLISASALSIPGVGRLLFDNLEQSLMRWVRSAELTCDRAALLVAQVLPLSSLPHPFPSQTPRDEAHRHIRCQEPMMCV